MSFSRRVLHMGPLPQTRFETSLPTRRDTRFARYILQQAPIKIRPCPGRQTLGMGENQ